VLCRQAVAEAGRWCTLQVSRGMVGGRTLAGTGRNGSPPPPAFESIRHGSRHGPPGAGSRQAYIPPGSPRTYPRHGRHSSQSRGRCVEAVRGRESSQAGRQVRQVQVAGPSRQAVSQAGVVSAVQSLGSRQRGIPPVQVENLLQAEVQAAGQ